MNMPLMFFKWGRWFLIFGSMTIGVILLLLLAIGSYHGAPQEPTKITLTATPQTPTTPAPTLALPSFAAPFTTQTNTTQQLAAQVAQEFLRLNPKGPTTQAGTKGIAAPDAVKLVNDFLAEGAKKFDYEKLKPAIKDGDIRIIETADPTQLAQYIKLFLTILNRIPANLDNPDAGSIDILVSVYDGYIRDYAALEVPRMLLSIHKKNLTTLVATKRMLAMVRDYQADPLQAVLAFQALENLRTDMQTLYTEVALFIADYQLKIAL